MSTGNRQRFTEAIGYDFADPAILDRALTHASARGGASGRTDYERLEFLGDRVLNLVVADLLFHRFPDEPEGDLAKRHSALVRTQTLADLGNALDIGEHAILSDGERRAGGRANPNILADMVEAVTAAIYLDGGYEAARDFIERCFGPRLDDTTEPPRDAKTALQEWTQAKGLGLPFYEMVGRSGPDHAPTFIVRLTVGGHPPVEAQSTSIKRAEKDAAKLMLDAIVAGRA